MKPESISNTSSVGKQDTRDVRVWERGVRAQREVCLWSVIMVKTVHVRSERLHSLVQLTREDPVSLWRVVGVDQLLASEVGHIRFREANHRGGDAHDFAARQPISGHAHDLGATCGKMAFAKVQPHRLDARTHAHTHITHTSFTHTSHHTHTHSP